MLVLFGWFKGNFDSFSASHPCKYLKFGLKKLIFATDKKQYNERFKAINLI